MYINFFKWKIRVKKIQQNMFSGVHMSVEGYFERPLLSTQLRHTSKKITQFIKKTLARSPAIIFSFG